MLTTIFTLITNIFSEDIMKYLGYTEIVIGVGQIIGPVIGGFVYQYLNFDKTLYFFGFLNTFGVICCMISIPNDLNKTFSEDEESD